MNSKKIESVAIMKLIFEDETGARVVIPMPRGLPLQEGGVLRSLSLGAISTTAIINDFKKARMKAAELKGQGVEGVSEMVHGSTQEKLKPFDADAQVAAMTAAADDQPPVFVPTGDEQKYCTCDGVMVTRGTRRCLSCGLLINSKETSVTT